MSLSVQPRVPTCAAIAVTFVLAIAAKSGAAIFINEGRWQQWLTPGIASGIVAGVVATLMLLRCSDRSRAWTGLCCLAAAVVIINVAPENPYQSQPAFLTGMQATQLFNFNHIVQSLSQAWPCAAAAFLLAAALHRSERTAR
jgi:hypothetical protein